MVAPQRLEDSEAYAYYRAESGDRRTTSNRQSPRAESRQSPRAESRQPQPKTERRTMLSRFSTDNIGQYATDGREGRQGYNQLFSNIGRTGQPQPGPLQFEFKLVLPAPIGASMQQMQSDITQITNFLAKTTLEYYKLAQNSCSSFLSQCTPSISLNMNPMPIPMTSLPLPPFAV